MIPTRNCQPRTLSANRRIVYNTNILLPMNSQASNYYHEKTQNMPDSDQRHRTELLDISSVRHVHIVGICGKLMSAIACLFKEAGYHVTGSDESWNPPASTVLENRGITGAPFDIQNIASCHPDVIIVGNAFSAHNPELAYAREHSIPQLGAPQAYARFFIQDKISCVITGTHGKTTTSGLMSWVLICADKDPTFLVGGVLQNTQTNYRLSVKEGVHSVIEGDEYDTAYFDKSPKMLHYKPYYGIITSLELDHTDIYKSLQDYQQAFYFFSQEINQSGALFVCEDVQEYATIRDMCKGACFVYGFSDSCDVYAYNIRNVGTKQICDIRVYDVTHTDVVIPMTGSYNILNTLAVIGCLVHNGLPFENIREGIRTFQGMKQRQEIRANNADIVVIEDFAHHPHAVSETLKGIAQAYPDKRIVAVFEPRSNTSRKKVFEQAYMQAFQHAHHVVIARPTIRHNDTHDDIIDTDAIVQSLAQQNISGTSLATGQEILEHLYTTVRPHDVVVIMSNGYFFGLAQSVASWVEGIQNDQG